MRPYLKCNSEIEVKVLRLMNDDNKGGDSACRCEWRRESMVGAARHHAFCHLRASLLSRVLCYSLGNCVGKH